MSITPLNNASITLEHAGYLVVLIYTVTQKELPRKSVYSLKVHTAGFCLILIHIDFIK